jgi:hypothetical protein
MASSNHIREQSSPGGGSQHRRSSSSESIPQSILLLEKVDINNLSHKNVNKNGVEPFPDQQLTLQEMNPFSVSVWSYNLYLGCILGCWVLYLLLPRGFRKQYCRSNVKRYSRRMDNVMPAAGYWLPVRSMQTQSTHSRSNEGSIVQGNTNIPQRMAGKVPAAISTNFDNGGREHPSNTPASDIFSPHRTPSQQQQRRLRANPPSPDHPAIKRIPPNKVIAETMARLQGRGIRLVAHGVHCDPKRVWIRLQDEEDEAGTGEACVTWQTEFPRRVPGQSGQVSIVLMRGSLHRIALKNILYVDVGKKTHALQLTQNVPETTCLSLLTQNGSLDLQANSKLERDSLVSCFSMILDDVHEEDWRALYEASPEPSLVNSNAAVNQLRIPHTAGIV